MALTLVPYQPILPGMKNAASHQVATIFRADPTEWTEATVRQRIKNALSYLEYQATKWKSQRDSPERWWYINGIRTLRDCFFTPAVSPAEQLTLAGLQPTAFYSPQELELMAESRPVLVARLMAADPLYTDRRLLCSLSRAKLAHMLLRALETEIEPERRFA